MVVYVYTVSELFFLNLVLKFAEFFDGLVGLLTLGFVHPGTNYPIFMELAKRELDMRARKVIKPRKEWPRLQIWPRVKP
jgi:hypothetical protein